MGKGKRGEGEKQMDESRSRSNSNKFCNGLEVWGSLFRGIKREWKEWRRRYVPPLNGVQQLR